MTNEEMNEIHINNAVIKKEAFYHKRIGECNPSICSSACCRFFMSSMHEDDYHQKITNWQQHPIKILKYKKKHYIISPFHCPEITVDGKCKLHNTKQQSKICDQFPMLHNDPMYILVKKFCGYKFEYVRIEDTK